MSERYVLKLHDMYVGGQVGTYKDDPSKITAQFYGDINDAALTDHHKTQEVFDLLIQHFPNLTVAQAHIAETNTQTTLFEDSIDEDS